MPTVGRDLRDRLLDADLKTSTLHLDVALGALGLLKCRIGVRDLLLRVADSLLEGVRVRLGEARAVTQALGPGLTSLVNRLVALMERIDAEA